MADGWVGSGYSGESNVRFPDGHLRRALIMLLRYPRIPESGDLLDGDYSTDDGYEDWWGYIRCEPSADHPSLTAPDHDEPLTVEPEERIPLRPNFGWPGKPLRLGVMHSRGLGRGFEALVREYFAPDGE